MKKHIEYYSHTYMGESGYHLDDVDFEPMHDLAYQYCEEDDTYYSLIKPEQVLFIIKQLNDGRRVDWSLAYHLGNTASDMTIVQAAIENDSLALMTKDDGRLFKIGVAAQYFDFDNTNIAEALIKLTYTKWDEPKEMQWAFNEYRSASPWNTDELEWLVGLLQEYKEEFTDSDGAMYRYWIIEPDFVHCLHANSLSEVITDSLHIGPHHFENVQVVEEDNKITVSYIDDETNDDVAVDLEKNTFAVSEFLSNLKDSVEWNYLYDVNYIGG